MGRLANLCYRCYRAVTRRPTFLKVSVVSALLVHLVFMVYIVCCKFGSDVAEQSPPYVLGLNGRSFYETDPRRLSCAERTDFVFIKGMKCATTTLLGVFYRFGYTRNLSFVTPLGNKIYLNWPFPITKLDYRPSSRGYNILTDHAILTEPIMSDIMPADTVYISIVREPFAHVQSVIQYFNILKVAGVPKNVSSPFSEYFHNIHQYETNYTSHHAKERWCIPDGFSLTRNLMSHCLGMPLGFPPGTRDISNSTAEVNTYLDHLDKKFALIMVVEYFYESIILLRRLMCWAFKDIIFVRSNVAKYDFNNSEIDVKARDFHRKWGSIDYQLYHFFNQTLWKRISEQGPRFFEEVAEFKTVEAKVMPYCQSIYQLGRMSQYPSNMSELEIGPSYWTEQFTVTPEDCFMLGNHTSDLRQKVQKENDVREANLLAQLQKITDNRTTNMKGLC